jgi:hypothetical protein
MGAVSQLAQYLHVAKESARAAQRSIELRSRRLGKRQQMLVLVVARSLAKFMKFAPILLDQLGRRPLLDEVALVHHEDFAAGHYGLSSAA